MNESKSNVPNMYQTIPAVAALNRVPGFEPMKLLRPARSRKTNEKVLKLALPYKKLWFRLAHPKGRIQINCLKLTEQIAIFEARVYLNREDSEPVSNFTASCIYDNTLKNDYIKDAQEEAINEALSIAGIGSQFADVEMTQEAERFGSEFPMSALPEAKPTPQTAPKPTVSMVKPQQPINPVANNTPVIKSVIKTEEPVEEKLPIDVAEETELPVSPNSKVQNMGVPSKDALPISPIETAAREEMKLPVEPAVQNVQQEKSMQAVLPMQSSQPPQANESQGILSATQKAMQILQGKANITNIAPATPPVAAVKPEEVKEAVPSKYTKNTPVPEIMELMTLEEAQKVVVDTGTCVGRTIQEVADTRPATLKYFQFGGYKGGNNILIAAATIMYKHLESQRLGKAG